MSLHYHEISERNHRILNPFTEDQLMLLGDICRLHSGLRQLDLCCGKAEMLCRWSAQFGIAGIGVDISPVFLAAAQRRAAELHVADRVTLVEGDAGAYPIAAAEFDVMSCIEPYWIDAPPDQAYDWIADGDRQLFTTLAGTLDRIEAAGLELVEMVLANHHGWDRYVAMQWMAVADWLRANPDSPDAAEIRRQYEHSRREYMTYGRRYLGWGVFVLRQP
jgi:SAM-dependent methyltransferase